MVVFCSIQSSSNYFPKTGQSTILEFNEGNSIAFPMDIHERMAACIYLDNKEENFCKPHIQPSKSRQIEKSDKLLENIICIILLAREKKRSCCPTQVVSPANGQCAQCIAFRAQKMWCFPHNILHTVN